MKSLSLVTLLYEWKRVSETLSQMLILKLLLLSYVMLQRLPLRKLQVQEQHLALLIKLRQALLHVLCLCPYYHFRHNQEVAVAIMSVDRTHLEILTTTFAAVIDAGNLGPDVNIGVLS